MYNTDAMGKLYVVATPIGNLQDITLRAVTTLKEVDLIVCEDSRLTGSLLHHLGIKKDMLSVNDANEDSKIYDVINLLNEGKNIALVSDAGTPLISDPGYKVVREAIKQGIQVIPIPGVSAAIAALSASGLPTDKFLFLGFSPDSLEHKKKFFKNVSELVTQGNTLKINPTIVFFESPHKLLRTLDAMKEVLGDIEIIAAREMTKIYEEFLRLKVSDMLIHFEKHQPKGEFVILFKL